MSANGGGVSRLLRVSNSKIQWCCHHAILQRRLDRMRRLTLPPHNANRQRQDDKRSTQAKQDNGVRVQCSGAQFVIHVFVTNHKYRCVYLSYITMTICCAAGKTAVALGAAFHAHINLKDWGDEYRGTHRYR